MKKVFLFGISALFVSLLFVYVVSDIFERTYPKVPDMLEDTYSKVANPASEFCFENDGDLEITDGVGICRLANGSLCDEWDYFKGNCS